MHHFKQLVLASGLMALASAPAHAFWDEMVVGMTSVTNNLIDSSENVTVTSVATTSNTVLLLSRDIGKMADRIDAMADKIGVMADRIGVMADRIVLTESMMANFAHKVVDRGHDLAFLQYGYAHGVPVQVPSRVQAAYSPAAPVYQGPMPSYQPVVAPYQALPGAYFPAAVPDVPHTLRASNPADNPYLTRAVKPVAPKAPSLCMAGMTAQNGPRAC